MNSSDKLLTVIVPSGTIIERFPNIEGHYP